MKPSVPHGDDERLVRRRQCAGKMNCIGAPQGELSRELTGLVPDGRRELDRAGRAAELFPARFGLLKAIPIEVLAPMRGEAHAEPWIRWRRIGVEVG